MTAHGLHRSPRGMNALEKAYEAVLAQAEDVAWYRYEGVTLKLAHDTRYTPDFAVMRGDGTLEMHEVKGPHRWEDSIVKLRCAAEMFPLVFVMATRSKDGAWEIREVGASVTKAVPVAVEQPSTAPGVRTSRRAEAGTSAALPDWRPGDVIPRGYVVLNGKLVTFDFAREKGWV